MARRRQPAALRKYWAKHRKNRSTSRRKNAPRRRRRARRNPWPVGGLVVNSRRRRRGRKNAARRHHRRRSMRRNPGIAGMLSMPKPSHILYTAGGFVGTPLLEGYVGSVLPLDIQTSTVGKFAVRIATVLGLTWAVSKFIGRAEGFYVSLGGWSYVGLTAINTFMPTLIPGATNPIFQLKAYRGGSLSGMGAYSNQTRSLRGYQPPAAPAVGNMRAVDRFSRTGVR